MKAPVIILEDALDEFAVMRHRNRRSTRRPQRFTAHKIAGLSHFHLPRAFSHAGRWRRPLAAALKEFRY